MVSSRLEQLIGNICIVVASYLVNCGGVFAQRRMKTLLKILFSIMWCSSSTVISIIFKCRSVMWSFSSSVISIIAGATPEEGLGTYYLLGFIGFI